jgi:ribosomal protein S8E
MKLRGIRHTECILIIFKNRTYSIYGLLYRFPAKQWKRMVTKATFVGPGFTRKPPKYERFIRPTGMRFTKAHVTHPELKCTFNLEIIGVKKNPNGPMYTSLGVMTRGSIIEVFIFLALLIRGYFSHSQLKASKYESLLLKHIGHLPAYCDFR